MKTTIFNNIFSAPPILVAGSVWYLITQKLAWLWHPGRVGRGCCAAALVIAGLFLVAGCSPDMSSLFCWFKDDCPKPPTPPTQIALIDISASTDEAKSAYKEQFEKDTREFALKQGTLDVILFAGDPLAESPIKRYTFSTTSTGKFGNADLEYEADTDNKKVEDLMDNPPITIFDSTSLLGAFLLADREVGKAKGPLDIVVYSDGIENSKDLSLLDSNQLDEAASDSTLDGLDKKGLIPKNLSGVTIRFPFLNIHPGGPQVADPLKVEAFWKAWAKRTGADLDLSRA